MRHSLTQKNENYLWYTGEFPTNRYLLNISMTQKSFGVTGTTPTQYKTEQNEKSYLQPTEFPFTQNKILKTTKTLIPQL